MVLIVESCAKFKTVYVHSLTNENQLPTLRETARWNKTPAAYHSQSVRCISICIVFGLPWNDSECTDYFMVMVTQRMHLEASQTRT